MAGNQDHKTATITTWTRIDGFTLYQSSLYHGFLSWVENESYLAYLRSLPKHWGYMSTMSLDDQSKGDIFDTMVIDSIHLVPHLPKR